MLNIDTLKQIAEPSDQSGRYIFDLSTISTEYYEPLLKTLQKFAQKNVVSLGFTCEELRKAEKRKVTGQQIPQRVLQSIAKKKTHYVRNVVELLCHILPKRTNLKEIVISSINLKPEFISRLAVAFSQSDSLQNIVFSYVNLMDSGLEIILSQISPNILKSLTFFNCSLSPASTNKILGFLAKKNPDGNLQEFIVSKTEFSDEDRRRIFDALGVDVPEPRMVSRQPKSSPPRKKAQNILTPEEIELEHLREENANLRNQLRSLRESVNAVQYSENVFVVGKGAEEFIKFLKTVESKIAKLEGKKVANN